jgi:hypothetical protein
MLVLPVGGISASIVSVEIEVDASAIGIIEDGDGGYRVDAAGMNRTNYLELPSLPYRVVSVLIPQGADVTAFRLEGGRAIELAGSISLAAFRGQLLGDGTSRGVYISMDEAVGKDSIFPAWKVRHTGTSGWKGYRIATFEVYPVRYDISTGRLTVVDGMRLVIDTAPGDTERDARRQRHVDGFRERSLGAIRRVVDNPQAASDYIFADIAVDENSRAFLPSYMPGMEGSSVQYLIVTNEEMAPEFQRLADWKTQKGVPAVVRTVEWIEQNTRIGVDLGETIRNFIREAYEKWGVEYVLLGGDTSVIPERFAYVDFYTGDFIPTDMYYGCLDGTWNADGDSIWGEGFHSLSVPGDDADLYAEVYVGRFPATTESDACLLVDKTIIHTLYLDPDPDITSIRLFENYPPYPGALQLTMESSLSGMDAGVNHVIHAGHGGKYNTSMGDGSILNNDADKLVNGSETFSMYLLNCDNVAFDSDCIAEYFMLNRDGGAFAVTGSSRSAFPSASRLYMDAYYELLFQDDIVQLGKVHVKSREPFTEAAYGETADRWTHFIYNYLGDPETNMYRGSPGTFDVTAPGTVPYGHNEIVIHVDSEGSP